MAFDPDKYLQEKTGGDTAAFDPDRYLAEKTGQAPQSSGGVLNALKSAAAFAGRQIDRVSAGPLRGAEEAIQNYEPDGNGSFHPGVIAAALKGAGQGFLHPDQVQSGQQMFARMGVSDKPSSQLTVMGTNGQPMNLGQDRPAGDPSLAATLGAAQDMLAPLPPVGAALRGAVKGAQQAAKVGEKVGISASERAILEQYNPTLLKELAPSISSSKTIKDAPAIVAQKLREHDLLYNPGKANFNLNRDLNATGKKIGDAIQEAKAKDVTVDVQAVKDNYLNRIHSALNESGQEVGSVEAIESDALPQIQKMIDRLNPDEAGRVAIDKGVNFRRDLQAMVKNWGDKPGKPVIQKVADDLQADMNQAIEGSDSRLGPRIAGLNRKYSDLAKLQPLIQDAYTRGFGKSAGGKVAQSGLAKALDAVIGENGKPLVKSALRAAASPVKTVLGIKPEWAEALANKGRLDYPDMYGSMPIPQVPADELAAIKAPFLPNASEGLPPRTPTMRRALDPKPTYVPQPNDAAPGLPPRQSSLPMQRRPISPIAEDPSLSVEHLGEVLDADAAKEIASTQYQSDRLKALWKKVQEAKNPKQRTALMNLIRSVHKSTPSK